MPTGTHLPPLSFPFARSITTAVTSGSGGTATTGQPLDSADAAAGFAAECNNTTVATTGTVVTLLADAWNIQGGWWYAPDEPDMLIIDVSTRLVFRITAPADAITLNATLVFEEIGLMTP